MQLDLESLTTTQLDRRFFDFHQANPHVYAGLAALARELLSKGHRTIGIGMLWEVLRWRSLLRTNVPSGEWKLDNSYRSRYARLLMEREPDLRGVFETRRLHTAEEP